MSVEKCTGERRDVGTAKQCSVKTRRRWKKAYGLRILLLKGGCERQRRNGEGRRWQPRELRTEKRRENE